MVAATRSAGSVGTRDDGLGNRRNGERIHPGVRAGASRTAASPSPRSWRQPAPPFNRGGHTRFGWACSSRIRRARANNVRTHGVPARARAGRAFARPTSEIPALQVFSRGSLADSNRRPPPYHLTPQATQGNAGQAIWLVFAHFPAGRFAVDCHWLRLLGSINAPQPVPRSSSLLAHRHLRSRSWMRLTDSCAIRQSPATGRRSRMRLDMPLGSIRGVTCWL